METSRPPVSHLEKLNGEFSRALKVIQKEFTERQRKEAEDFGRSLQIVISKQREIESLLRSNMDGDASKEFRMLMDAIGFIPSNASIGVVSALNYMVEKTRGRWQNSKCMGPKTYRKTSNLQASIILFLSIQMFKSPTRI